MGISKKTPALKTVEKALDILDAFGFSGHPMTATECSETVGLSLSSTYKFLSTLSDKGYLDYQPSNKQYSLSSKFLYFSNQMRFNMQINQIAYPFMQELAAKTHETIHLAMPQGFYAVFVEKIDSPQTIGVQTRIGTRTLLNCGATPQSIMAFLDRQTFSMFCEYLSQQFPDAPEIVQAAVDQREKLRREGYALTFEEINKGVAAVAAPIFNSDSQVVASMAIAAPKERFTPDHIQKYIPMITDSCRRVSEALGYRGGQLDKPAQ